MLIVGVIVLFFSCEQNLAQSNERQVFPHKLPESKPSYPLSAATERMFEYPALRRQDNELFTQFKYTKLEGFDYNNYDGTITRRDPSRPILVDGKYYTYYTKRHTKVVPVGWHRAKEATDEIPSTDWDLADIWYATSTDGFKWEEQGIAVARPEKPALGWRSVATPDILVWKGKYYLYFQAFNEPSGTRGDWCPVSMAYADSPDGPWTHTGVPAVKFGKKGDWDQDQSQDPHLIVYKNKIYLYYKAAFNKWPDVRDKYAVCLGVAIADNPFGPFKKHPLNPVVNSGHETCFFPFKEGIASLVITDGNEAQTMQYAADGVNFEIAATIELPPKGCGFYTPDAFTGTDYGRGVTWGLCFFSKWVTGRSHSYLARVDCDLSLDVHDPYFKRAFLGLQPETYFEFGLGHVKNKRLKMSTVNK